MLVKRGTSGSLLVGQGGECLAQPIFKAAQVQAGPFQIVWNATAAWL